MSLCVKGVYLLKSPGSTDFPWIPGLKAPWQPFSLATFSFGRSRPSHLPHHGRAIRYTPPRLPAIHLTFHRVRGAAPIANAGSYFETVLQN